jgi:hypothetical protein
MTLAADLEALRAVIAADGDAVAIDEALLPLASRDEAIAPILLFLNEDGDQDGMWSIVHVAEAFEDAPYVAGFLDALPELAGASPWWARTLMIRVLNQDATRTALVRRLPQAPSSVKAATILICERVVCGDAGFIDKAEPVLSAARG